MPRPAKKKKKTYEGFLDVQSEFEEDCDTENVIVNVQQLNEAVKAFIVPHSKTTKCINPNPTTRIRRRQGLCITIEVICSTCRFKSTDTPLYREVKKPAGGPAAGSLNDRLALSAMQNKSWCLRFIFYFGQLRHQAPIFCIYVQENQQYL